MNSSDPEQRIRDGFQFLVERLSASQKEFCFIYLVPFHSLGLDFIICLSLFRSNFARQLPGDLSQRTSALFWGGDWITITNVRDGSAVLSAKTARFIQRATVSAFGQPVHCIETAHCLSLSFGVRLS
jgi:hypothetical protein